MRNKTIKLCMIIAATGIMFLPALGYAQSSESAVTSTIGYFYSASGQMMDAEDNSGAMSSYLTRGERNDGTSETFAVSNIKDITADLDSNGNVLSKYTYTAYGIPTSYTPSTQITTSTTPQLSLSVNPFTYDGYYTDGESANYYLNARYYDPVLGIFLTSDSYNLPNRYMYVNGNPVMATDPTGHFFEELGNFAFGCCKRDGGGSKWETDADRQTRLNTTNNKQLIDNNSKINNDDVGTINNSSTQKPFFTSEKIPPQSNTQANVDKLMMESPNDGSNFNLSFFEKINNESSINTENQLKIATIQTKNTLNDNLISKNSQQDFNLKKESNFKKKPIEDYKKKESNLFKNEETIVRFQHEPVVQDELKIPNIVQTQIPKEQKYIKNLSQ